MSSRRRTLAIAVLTLAIVGGGFASTAARIHAWHEQGWTGLYYYPEMKMPAKKGRPAQTISGGQVVMVYGSTPADGRILPTDRVEAVNGIPISDLQALQRLDKQIPAGAEVTVRVRRDDRMVDVPLRLASPLRSPYIVIKTIVSFFVAIVFVGVAIVVFVRRPEDRRAAHGAGWPTPRWRRSGRRRRVRRSASRGPACRSSLRPGQRSVQAVL